MLPKKNLFQLIPRAKPLRISRKKVKDKIMTKREKDKQLHAEHPTEKNKENNTNPRLLVVFASVLLSH